MTQTDSVKGRELCLRDKPLSHPQVLASLSPLHAFGTLSQQVMWRRQVMWLDEPTSGLDSFNALMVMSSLQTLTAAGRTIVATIHQPSADV